MNIKKLFFNHTTATLGSILFITALWMIIFQFFIFPEGYSLKLDPPAKKLTVALPGLPEEATPMVLRHIPAGSFIMGSTSGEKYHEENESPRHKVIISKPFYMGKYEVTQAQWEAIMGYNPSTQININLPVNRVNWHDAQAFLKKLNDMDLPSIPEFWNSGYFRLPTEAEHEYACRAGTQMSTYFGDNPSMDEILQNAWIRDNSDAEMQKVGKLNPNPWGLHDMLGNVWEWCYDWYGPYPEGKQVDPIGPESGKEKVFRGPSWMGRREYVRCADRGKFPPDFRRNTGGFRVVWSKEKPWD